MPAIARFSSLANLAAALTLRSKYQSKASNSSLPASWNSTSLFAISGAWKRFALEPLPMKPSWLSPSPVLRCAGRSPAPRRLLLLHPRWRLGCQSTSTPNRRALLRKGSAPSASVQRFAQSLPHYTPCRLSCRGTINHALGSRGGYVPVPGHVRRGGLLARPFLCLLRAGFLSPFRAHLFRPLPHSLHRSR